MKKYEVDKIIHACYAEFDKREVNYDSSWEAYREEVRSLYAIVRRHFGKAAAKKHTVAYFADSAAKSFSEKMLYSEAAEALKTAV